jgi:hypothetical protein
MGIGYDLFPNEGGGGFSAGRKAHFAKKNYNISKL